VDPTTGAGDDLPLSGAEVLGEHVCFERECIDRVYCNAYVPKLAYPIQRYAAEREIPVVRFEKGQRKDDVAQEQLARFGEPEGIYMVGVAQEKISTFRTKKRRNPETGASYPWIVRASAVVNQYYM
jgi:hypothetical protein